MSPEGRTLTFAGFEVAVDDAGDVRRRDGSRELPEDRERRFRGDRTLADR